MMPEDAGTVRQQIGEILGTVRSLSDALKEVKEDGVRREDRITSEIRTIKHEQRQSDQVIASRMELLTAQFRELDAKARTIGEELTKVKLIVADLEQLKDPVQKLQALRDRIIGYVLAVTGVCGVVWWLISPYISEFLRRLFFGASR